MIRTLILIVAGHEVGEMQVDVHDGTKVLETPLPAILLLNLSAVQARELSDMTDREPKETP